MPTTRRPRPTALLALPFLLALHAEAAQPPPQAAVVERKETRVAFERDGRAVREVVESVRVLTEAGVKELAVLKVPYFTASQVLEVEHVRVRKSDGTVIETPPGNVQDLPAEVSRTAPMYSDIHEKNIVVKGLAAGDTLDLAFRVRTDRPEVPGRFWFEYYRNPMAAVKAEILEIEAPAGLEVRVNSPAWEPERRVHDGRNSWIWRKFDVDPRAKAPVPRMQAAAPDVQVSNFPSWEALGDWFRGIMDAGAVVTPAVKAKAEELTRGIQGDRERIRALYGFVSKDIHYVSLSFGLGRYAPHAADEVLGNGYGDCKDKHTLLAALLKASGYQPMPALVQVGGHVDAAVPSPGSFNHVITGVVRPEGTLFMDATLEVAPMGLLLWLERDRPALVVPPSGPAVLRPVQGDPGFPNESVLTVTGTYRPDGTCSGSLTQASTGDSGVFTRTFFRTAPSARWKEFLKSRMEMPGYTWSPGEVETSAVDDPEKPISFTFPFTAGLPDKDAQAYLLPYLPRLDTWTWPEKDAVDPLALGFPGTTRQVGEFTLPKGWTPVLPQPVDLVNPHASYRSSCSFSGSTLRMERTLVLRSAEVPVADLASFRKFQELVRADVRQILAIQAGPPPKGPRLAGRDGGTSLLVNATTAMDRGDFPGAEEALRKALKQTPPPQGARILLGFVLTFEGRDDEAAKEFQRALEDAPDDARARVGLAMAYAHAGKADLALAEGRKLLDLGLPDATGALSVINALIPANGCRQALDLVAEAGKRWPGAPGLRWAQARALAGTGEGERALALFEEELAGKDEPQALNDAAYALAEAGTRLDRALEWARKAVAALEQRCAAEPGGRDQGSLAAAWDTLGWIRYRLGDAKAALPFVFAGWNLNASWEGGAHLAGILKDLGRGEEAERACVMAAACPGAFLDRLRSLYRDVAGGDLDARLGRRPSGKELLEQSRTLPLNFKPRAAGYGYVYLTFSQGSLIDVSWQGGYVAVQPDLPRLKTLRFPRILPDDGPEKVRLQAVFTCQGPSQGLRLLPMGSPWGTPAPAKDKGTSR